ncbi:hypothetical protein AXG93_115s1780 [Marchantia polymorpha subsp. ruderalis]|uniref:Uncharacterized protein n=1 Tax=Marchantia polymorpha subsp. ruderalis TaxID=1480154 RepID=A0A176W5Y5_MARPO|nr:hypothetical protein AXG93_115s1780 [Marchantia polymorpha subsp. ruderalis]
MGLLIPAEIEVFPSREVEEVVLANESNSDLESEPRNSPQQRRKRSPCRQDSQPRKRRRIDEAAVADRLRRTALIEMQSSDFRTKSKMKARRLILEEDSSTESRRAVLRGRPVQEAGPAERAAKEIEKSVLSLLQYLDWKREKYAEVCTNESYEEIVRKRTRTKVAVTAEIAVKERKSQPTEAKYQALQKRLEACRTAYDTESLKVDELSTAAKEKEQEYQIELAVRAKKLTEYEGARILDLELIDKLEAQCGELKTQRSQTEEQLCEMKAKLTEAEGKNRQLSEETRDALTARV